MRSPKLSTEISISPFNHLLCYRTISAQRKREESDGETAPTTPSAEEVKKEKKKKKKEKKAKVEEEAEPQQEEAEPEEAEVSWCSSLWLPSGGSSVFQSQYKELVQCGSNSLQSADSGLCSKGTQRRSSTVLKFLFNAHDITLSYLKNKKELLFFFWDTNHQSG